jgi:hypothetical protein
VLPNTNISMLITSCNRPDLLKTTLESYFQNCDIEPQEVIIYEDSDQPKPEFLNDWDWRRRHVKWISDGERKGQAYACARLIREAKYDYTLWFEEDWLTQKGSGSFIRESKELLDRYPHIIQVSLRGDTGWHPLTTDPQNPELKIADPYWRGVWGGWSWNPGLRRTKELKEVILPRITRQIGADGLKHEEAVSKELLDLGYRIADLNRSIVTHLGGGRSRAIEKLPPLPKILIAVPTCFEFDYESHALQNAEKFHVNGANEQTQAVRETWGKDFLQYPNVDVRFFYGRPESGYPRKPFGDEIFLECGDGYDSLIQKTYGICKYAAENGYRFVYKADTDTFVYADRLLLEIMENHFDYAGYLHADVCSGGPGYLLSQRACDIIRTLGRSPRHFYAEDVHVSRVLSESGIRGLMLPAHRPGFSAHFFFGNPDTFDPTCITGEIVSAHAVFPKQMRDWHAYLKAQSQQPEGQNVSESYAQTKAS